ncbi:hypothetical protein [Ureaplasma canigenitalium]|uniref:hypothetical protein n=1 Tax=Ureaplasma canigenitalium TaxID=42092 RepID=UPI0004E22362|nr:hypothetical protein [Ureaplasma canigenitalium]
MKLIDIKKLTDSCMFDITSEEQKSVTESILNLTEKIKIFDDFNLDTIAPMHSIVAHNNNQLRDDVCGEEQIDVEATLKRHIKVVDGYGVLKNEKSDN